MIELSQQTLQTESNSNGRQMEGAAEALLQDVLACLRRHRDTPLLVEDEGLPMSEGAFRALALKHFPQQGNPRPSAVDVRSALDQLVDQALNEGQPAAAGGCTWVFSAADNMEHRASAIGEEIETVLRTWIEGLWLSLREVHPRAIEIVALHCDGFHERDVAERVALPLRLLRRIIRDVQAALRRTRES